MKTNPIKIKNYANYVGSKSILKTKPVKINAINPSTVSLDKQQFDYLTEMKNFFGRKFGVAKVQRRDTGEFVNANLWKFGGLGRKISLESNGKRLISAMLEPNDILDIFNHGLEIAHISKTADGENFKGIAKMMDRIAVKISKSVKLGGEVNLKTAAGYSTEEYAIAEPIHWSRGYVDVDYLENEAEYDKKMSGLFKRYQQSRQNGKTIAESKLDVNIDYLPETTMYLKEEKVKEYLKDTALLELF